MAQKDLLGALDSLVEARMYYASANDKEMVRTNLRPDLLGHF